MTGAVQTLTDNCIRGITANAQHCAELEEGSAGIATALCPALGYRKSAEIAKKALRENRTIRDIVLEEKLMPADELDRLLNPRTMTRVKKSA